jgi:hypothetical protein
MARDDEKDDATAGPLIFLDIDGVLRRRTAPLYRLEEPLRRAFEGLLESLPAVRVVIASSWREGFSLDEIRGHFSPALRDRLVSVTPRATEREGAYREREVRAWLRRHAAPGTTWVALDDDASLYGRDAPLVWVDPDRGLDAEAVAAAKERLGG